MIPNGIQWHREETAAAAAAASWVPPLAPPTELLFFGRMMKGEPYESEWKACFVATLIQTPLIPSQKKNNIKFLLIIFSSKTKKLVVNGSCSQKHSMQPPYSIEMFPACPTKRNKKKTELINKTKTHIFGNCFFSVW